jgi:hypothetical protein
MLLLLLLISVRCQQVACSTAPCKALLLTADKM